MRRTLAPLVLLLLVASSPNAPAQTCPTIYSQSGGNGSFYEESSTSPTGSFSSFSYNLVAGTVEGSLQGFGEMGTFALISAQDRYAIVGPSTATPIAFLARVRFTGTVGAGFVFHPQFGQMCTGSTGRYSLASGSLTDEVEVRPTVSQADCQSRTFDETLELALSKLPGEEFPLTVGANHTAGHMISITGEGTISFAGLPPGYSIRSCHGYAGVVVATVARSWGSIKGLYR